MQPAEAELGNHFIKHYRGKHSLLASLEQEGKASGKLGNPRLGLSLLALSASRCSLLADILMLLREMWRPGHTSYSVRGSSVVGWHVGF